MFRCSICGRVAPRREPASRVVLRTRPKTYPFRRAANPMIARFVNGRERKWRPDDPGGEGEETVLEVLACRPCAAAAMGLSPDKPA